MPVFLLGESQAVWELEFWVPQSSVGMSLWEWDYRLFSAKNVEHSLHFVPLVQSEFQRRLILSDPGWKWHTKLREECGVISIGVPSISFIRVCSFSNCVDDLVFNKNLLPLSKLVPGRFSCPACWVRLLLTINGFFGRVCPSSACNTRNFRSPLVPSLSIYSGRSLVLLPGSGGGSLLGGEDPSMIMSRLQLVRF